MAASIPDIPAKKPRRVPFLPKFKILALHGYCQSGESFNKKIAPFRKAVRPYATVKCLTAPHIVQYDPEIAAKEGETDPRAWWFNSQDYTYRPDRTSLAAFGFDDTLKCIEGIFRDHGPFDGIMGFAQGGCLAAMLSSMLQLGYLKYSFKFVIIMFGYCSTALVHKGLYDQEIQLPSMHLYDADAGPLEKEMSDSLAIAFANPRQQENEKGPDVECSRKTRLAYKKFFEQVRDDEVHDSILLTQVLPTTK